jgi:hypothetical protein
MKVRGMLCALVAGSCLAVAAVPSAVGETGCGPGYEEGVGEEYDTDDDGMVCVNQETGAVSDDQGAQPGAADRNGDGIVCVKATGSGSIVTTDNNSNHPENGGCPPSFQPSPLT